MTHCMEKILNILILLAVALLIPGIISRVKARLCGKKGPSLRQHLLDLRRLLGKGAVYSTTTSELFRIAPAVYLGSAAVALLFIPVAWLSPVLSFEGDVVMFAYLLALGRFALILAALDTGSSFEGMGASREALYGALLEPALFIVAATLAMVTGYTSFGAIFSATEYDPRMVMVLLLLAYVVVKVFTVEMGRIPVDDPRTHLELTMIHEVMVLDYCGVDLGMIHLAGWLKGGAMAMIAADCAVRTFAFHPAAAAAAATAVGAAVGVLESLRARNKLSRNTTYILSVTAIAFVVLFVAYMSIHNIGIKS